MNTDLQSKGREAEPSVMPRKRSKEPRYFEIHPDYLGKPLLWKLENADRLQPNRCGLLPLAPWPDGYLQLPHGPWTLPQYLERPRLVIDEKKGRLPRDLEALDWVFFISESAKAVFETLDQTACDIRPCDTFLSSGERGPKTWICSITRAFVGAVDLERSEKLWKSAGPGGLPLYGLGGGAKLRLRQEVVKGAPLFHIAEMGTKVFCDEAFRLACKEVGLKGIRFTSYQ